MKTIAVIHTAFPEKFGIPRQAGLVEECKAQIVFAPEYRSADALRGIDAFSHLWLLWEFSEAKRDTWSPLVRPPRLGGNEKKGVFATRSPFRPNPIGLSCVRLESVEWEGKDGPILHVSGADCMDGTPIYDIKPYIPYADCRPEATDGFAPKPEISLEVRYAEGCREKLREPEVVTALLQQDPRPHYQDDPERIYGLTYEKQNVCFTVKEGVVTVIRVEKCQNG